MTTDATTPVLEEATQPPAKKRKRKPRQYKVSVTTPTHQSTTEVTRSGPAAAASDGARANIHQFTLKEPHKVWVKSNSKFHPYTIIRNYDNKKLRRFTLAKAGPSISLKDGNDPSHQIPANLL